MQGGAYNFNHILNELWEGEMWGLLAEFNKPPEFITSRSGITRDNDTDYSSWDVFMKQRYFMTDEEQIKWADEI
jgi:hypothetical protein